MGKILNFRTFAYLLLVIIIGMIILAAFSSCNTYKKQLAKFNAFADANPNPLAAKCVQYFPVKDSVGKAVITIDSTHHANNANLQPTVDSLQKIADAYKQHLAADTGKSNPCATQAKEFQTQYNTLYNKFTGLNKAYKPCKPDIQYLTKTVPIYQTDEAALQLSRNRYNVAHDSLVAVQTTLKQTKETSDSRLKWIFILAGILALSVVVTILKFMGKLSFLGV